MPRRAVYIARVKIVLTGCAGRLGAGTAAALAEAGHEVLGLDQRRSRPWHPWGPPPEQPGEAFAYAYADLRERHQFDAHVAACDAVVHLGEISNASMGPPEVVYATNTRIGSAVLQACADHGVRRVVYASTAQTYGFCGPPHRPPASVPADEEHPQRATNPYALSKVANESFARMLGRTHGLSVAAVRPPWVMMPREAKWVRGRYAEGKTKPAGDVNDFGTYLMVEDWHEAVVRLVAYERAGYDAYNLAAPDLIGGHPLGALIDAFDPTGHGHPADTKPDVPIGYDGPLMSCAKIEAHLGWRPGRSVNG